MDKIYSAEDLSARIREYGILPFWSEDGFSAWQLSGVNFNTLWSIREAVVNTRTVAYGKFVNKKATFVSLDVFPYLCSLRRDGYDFDSAADEGKMPNREISVMKAVGDTPTPSYNLGKTLGIKGYDSAVTSLQNKTYLCLNFKKSMMGTALLCRPEVLFGDEKVRSAYSLSPAECAEQILKRASGLKHFSDAEIKKILTPAVI
ncbi:MAG: hypothetical protein NC184_04500 [Roseburia sp.]|nr:hypothetical protein [Roseburia sp.]